jgi:hypothetical protein
LINVHNTQQVKSYIEDFIYIKQDETCEEDRLHYLIHVLAEIAMFEGWEGVGERLENVFNNTAIGRVGFKEE